MKIGKVLAKVTLAAAVLGISAAVPSVSMDQFPGMGGGMHQGGDFHSEEVIFESYHAGDSFEEHQEGTVQHSGTSPIGGGHGPVATAQEAAVCVYGYLAIGGHLEYMVGTVSDRGADFAVEIMTRNGDPAGIFLVEKEIGLIHRTII